MFHGVQPQLGPLGAPGLATEHLDALDGRYWLRLEWRALARALRESGEQRNLAVRDALAFRRRVQMLLQDATASLSPRMTIRRTLEGAGYKAESVNILHGARDQWFRPSDVCVAPDGSLIIADWYDPGVGGQRITHVLGRAAQVGDVAQHRHDAGPLARLPAPRFLAGAQVEGDERLHLRDGVEPGGAALDPRRHLVLEEQPVPGLHSLAGDEGHVSFRLPEPCRLSRPAVEGDQGPQGGESVHPWHADIEHDASRPTVINLLQKSFWLIEVLNLESEGMHQLRNRLAGFGIIVREHPVAGQPHPHLMPCVQTGMPIRAGERLRKPARAPLPRRQQPKRLTCPARPPGGLVLVVLQGDPVGGQAHGRALAGQEAAARQILEERVAAAAALYHAGAGRHVVASGGITAVSLARRRCTSISEWRRRTAGRFASQATSLQRIGWPAATGLRSLTLCARPSGRQPCASEASAGISRPTTV